MSTTLDIATRLPIVAKPTGIAIGEVSVSFQSSQNTYTIKYTVTATGLEKVSALVSLFHVEDKPTSGNEVLVAKVILPKYNVDDSMQVDGAFVPTAATAPYPKFYLLLTCGTITALSLPFDFFAPPRSSDFPRTIDEVGAVFYVQGKALTKTVKDKDGKDIEVPVMKTLKKKGIPVLDENGKPKQVPIRQQLVRKKDSKPGALPVFKKGDLIYKKNGQPKLEPNDPGFVYRGHHGRIVKGTESVEV